MKFLMQSPPGPRVRMNDKDVDYFCGCCYLGLNAYPDMVEAACRAARTYGIGCGTSRAGHGNNPVLLDVEARAARFFQAEAALYYVSGYLGMLILLQGLSEDYDVIFCDAASHYSVRTAAAAAGKSCIPFAHRSPEDLRRQLENHLQSGQRPLVLTDGVFPISGEIAPVADYLEVVSRFDNFTICLDDAHAYGVLGDNGRGVRENFHLEKEPNIYSCGTLSKAFGGHGGIITGTQAFIDRLKTKSDVYYASSAVPNPSAAATACAIDLAGQNPHLRRQLWQNVALARNEFRRLGFPLADTPVPIVALHSRPDVDLEKLADVLFTDRNKVVRYVAPDAYSGVPAGGAIRIAIFANHTEAQILALVQDVREIIDGE
ncbi:MAG: pyridoxal phosphate-dependent aminotransferase family protein [Sedimentisphaerales bacterium]|nr:pyridoxal phosphate-dependent aminotransferase family protein [Sedimentisphaerales bacterium]